MASTYLSRTNESSVTNNNKCTISVWVKRSGLGSYHDIIAYYADAQNYNIISLGTDKIAITNLVSNVVTTDVQTDAVFRDTSAWYHFVIAFDTTQATASDRVKVYVNGVEDTSLVHTTSPSQNSSIPINTASLATKVGSYGSGNYFDGSMAHFHLIDGTAYDASAFGETDSTTGIWKPKTAPSVTYGTNGFFLKFENSGSMGTDSSGNANNFTVNGTPTQTVDTPSNVFATLDALQDYAGWHTLSNGNTSVSFTGPYGVALTNLGITSGKYYCEVKCVAEGSPKGCSIGTVNKQIGFGSFEYMNGAGYAYWRANGPVVDNSGNAEYTGSSWGTNDILMIALDLDNNNLYFGKNGTWENSGVPTSGATGTGAVTLSASPDYPFFFCCDRNDSGTPQFSWNFGNGYFGTTAVSSAQNPDDGIGIFEYDVPTGYRALCTKSINAQEYS